MGEAPLDRAVLVDQFSEQLEDLVAFWVSNVVDTALPGFHGEIDAHCQVNPQADRGAVLCARLLWFLSEAAMYLRDRDVAAAADHIYLYANKAFRDEESGGFHWLVDADSSLASGRKQTFGQAFFIYAFSSYYRLGRDDSVLAEAQALWRLLEDRTKSPDLGAHLAAFDSTWEPLENMGLDDINAPFTFDTELHVLEAYASLYRVSPSCELEADLRQCLEVIERYFLDRGAWAMHSHVDTSGTSVSRVVLYGHTVESAWLIWDALEALDDPKLSAHWRPLVLSLIQRAVADGMSADGRLYEGYDRSTGAKIENSVWWMQAEMLVALLVADKLEPNGGYLGTFQLVWDHVLAHHIETQHGEWLAAARDEGVSAPLVNEWKGPYHNGRAILVALKHLTNLESN